MSIQRLFGDGPVPAVRDTTVSAPKRHGNAVNPYEGATMGRRTATFTPTRDAVNSVWWASTDLLVSRCRDQVRKDSWAAKAVDEWVGNAIGTGIKPQSRHSKKGTRKKLQQIWDQHSQECDVGGLTDMYGLQALAFRSMVEGGECFTRKHTVDDDPNLTLPLQYQIIESEQLPYYLSRPTPETPAGRKVVASIEVDPAKRNKRMAYYFYKEHPGERIFYSNALDIIRVPADEVMHLFRPLRPGQMRGFPWLANSLIRLWELDQYDDAELLRKKFAAMLMAFITRTNSDGSAFPGATDAITDVSGQTQIQTQQQHSMDPSIQEAMLEAGTMMDLEVGEDVKFTAPADVGGNYEAFERQMLHRIAAGVGLPYYMLTGDLSQASYGSLRAGMLAFRRLCEQIQFGCFVFQFCRPTWKAMVEAAVLSGQISAKDYAVNKADYLAVDWRTPKWDWIDPEKDLKAEVLAVRAGFKARSQSIHETGEDPDTVSAQIKSDNEEADANEFVFDSDARRTDNRGAQKVEPVDAGEGEPPASGSPAGGNKKKPAGSKEVIQ